jgi:hypothetical protein
MFNFLSSSFSRICRQCGCVSPNFLQLAEHHGSRFLFP